MPLAVHGSTPALTEDDDSCTTASFTAPAESLLVALCMADSGSGATTTVSNSGTGLSWQTQVNHQDGQDSGAYDATVKIVTAPVLTSVSRTVTLSTSGGGYTALKLLVITGADLITSVGAVGEGHSTTANLNAAAYTSTVAGSLAVGIASDDESFNGLDTPTSSDVGFPYSTIPDPCGIAVYKAATTALAGTGVTLNFNGTGATRQWNWVAAEILPLVAAPVGGRGRVLGQAVHRAANY